MIRHPALDKLLPRVLPAFWREMPSPVPGTRLFETAWCKVIAGVEDRGHGTGLWFHVSLSKRDTLPSWSEVLQAKELYMGRERCAIHLLPPREFYVNYHPYTLHLWSRLDEPTVPPRLYEDQ